MYYHPDSSSWRGAQGLAGNWVLEITAWWRVCSQGCQLLPHALNLVGPCPHMKQSRNMLAGGCWFGDLDALWPKLPPHICSHPAGAKSVPIPCIAACVKACTRSCSASYSVRRRRTAFLQATLLELHSGCLVLRGCQVRRAHPTVHKGHLLRQTSWSEIFNFQLLRGTQVCLVFSLRGFMHRLTRLQTPHWGNDSFPKHPVCSWGTSCVMLPHAKPTSIEQGVHGVCAAPRGC